MSCGAASIFRHDSRTSLLHHGRKSRSVMANLQRMGHDDSLFVPVPRPDAKDAKWAAPKLVAEVQFTTWTRGGPGAAFELQGNEGGQAANERETGIARI